MHVIGHCDYSECKQTVVGVGKFRVGYATSDFEYSNPARAVTSSLELGARCPART